MNIGKSMVKAKSLGVVLRGILLSKKCKHFFEEEIAAYRGFRAAALFWTCE